MSAQAGAVLTQRRALRIRRNAILAISAADLGTMQTAHRNILEFTCGFNRPTTDMILAQGYDTPYKLQSLDGKGLEKMTTHLSRTAPKYHGTAANPAFPPPAPPAGGGQAAPPPPALPIVLSYHSMLCLQAYHMWLAVQALQGKSTVDLAHFDAATLDEYLARVSDLPALLSVVDTLTVPEPLKQPEKYFEWEEQVQDFFSKVRSDSAGAPLSYLLREEIPVTADALTATYDDIDQELIATTTHSGIHYIRDSKVMYTWLEKMTYGGMAFQQVKPHSKTKNGPQAYRDIKLWFAGKSGTTTLRLLCYKRLDAMQYTGQGGMTLPKMLTQMKLLYSTLEKTGEPVADTLQCSKILEAIKADYLDSAKDIAKSNDALLCDPDELSRHFMVFARDGTDGKKRKRTISKVRTGKHKGGKGSQEQEQQQQQQKKSKKNLELAKKEPEAFGPFEKVPGDVYRQWSSEQRSRKYNRCKKANDLLEKTLIAMKIPERKGSKFEGVKAKIEKAVKMQDEVDKKNRTSIKAASTAKVDTDDEDSAKAQTSAGVQFGRKKVPATETN